MKQQPYEARNLSVSIACDVDRAYGFLSRPENFPRWASGLGAMTRSRDGSDDEWIAHTPAGPTRLRFSPPNAFGVLDHWVVTEDGTSIYIPMRLVANAGGCLLLFTLFRLPGMTDQRLAEDADWVTRDLEAARALLESTAD